MFAAASTGMSLGVTGTSTDQKNVKMDEAWILSANRIAFMQPLSVLVNV